MNCDFENYKIWLTKQLTPEEFSSLNNLERLKYIASLGHLAPSSHNTQPWLFEIIEKGNQLNVYLDKNRVLPVSDVQGRQALVSLGCVLTNIEVAISYLWKVDEIIIHALGKENVKPNTNQATKNERFILICSFKLSKLPEPNQGLFSLYSSVFSRRVDRGEFDPDKKINIEIVEKAKNISNIKGVNVLFISDWGRKNAIAELQNMADSFVINNKKFAQELFNDWFIENDSESGLGMPGNTFYLNDEQTLKIKNRFKIGLGVEASDIGAIANQGKRGILSSQLIGLILCDNDDVADWLNAGKLLENIMLYFESQGISSAFHAGLAEVKEVNTFILRPIIMSTKKPIILFRSGYLKSFENRAPHSPRLRLSEVTKIS